LTFTCSISDTGIGIPQSKLPHLFESFTQADASTTRQFGGTGLGLAIVRELTALMKGGVSVASVEGQGSCFEFSVLLQSSEGLGTTAPGMDLQGTKILIADNSATSRESISRQLKNCGASVLEAEDGTEALAELERLYCESGKTVDLLFLDMDLSGMDVLANQLNGNDKFGETPLIGMMSVSGLDDPDCDLILASWAHKPVTPTALFDAITSAKKNDAASQCRSDGGELVEVLHSLAGTHVLLVEDNLINQEVVLGILEDLELRIDIAEDGLAAINSLVHSTEDNPYKVVLMDCQMPQMDGYEATQKIRAGDAGNRYEQVPVIALTANAMEGDREKCLAAGMDDYLAKPIDPDALEEKLNEWLAVGSQ
jgi:CheY-like chemotaxis protein